MNTIASVDDFAARMKTHGWFIFERAISVDLVKTLGQALDRAWEICHAIQLRAGVASDADRTVHHLVGLEDCFIDLLAAMEVLDPHMRHYFGGQYILNSLGGAVNTRDHTSYAQRVHRDIRSYSGDMPLLLNTLVMLDDFTAENGATYMMTGAQRMPEKPTDEAFYAQAEQAIAPAGSVLMFDSNLWHSGGNNRTDGLRRSVTPMFCKPFIKPQYDYPRALGYDRGDQFSAFLRQVIGYNARIPANLYEWYQPPARRMYRPDQG